MAQEKELSFEELVKNAYETADARTKAFANLQKKLEEVYIPKMQEILTKCGKESVRIITEKPLLDIKEDYSEEYRPQTQYAVDSVYDEKYCLYITKDFLIEGLYDYQTGWCKKIQREYKIRKSGVVEFANQIKKKLEDLVKIAAEEEKAANEALNF